MRFTKPPILLPVAIPTKSPFADIGPRVLNHAQFKKPSPNLTQWPQRPSDIKGIDANASMWLRQKQVNSSVPILAKNDWFMLQFYPASHPLSKYRKSLVALTFTMIPGARFDDKELDKRLSQYKGKFQSDVYFKSSLRPCDTAWGRTTFKKLSRDAMFEALSKLDKRQQSMVSGVWRIQYYAHPVGDSSRRRFFEEWQQAVRKAVLVKFQQKVNDIKPINKKPPYVSTLDAKIPHSVRLPYYTDFSKSKPKSRPKKRNTQD
ncbi:hypothetical protein DIURU_002340 [Diutina rugosa]|uniref:Uncharacterized protein n=1 Tax=Diutina rugosa TaxID=5481 RepID=A0A642UQM6_DIURU|nr:uncharacterized protein DIURU_002340 [Diutina rugosa]KAA8903454.1 hypothetical protein DIURU_002340 [Diutina rugosa]